MTTKATQNNDVSQQKTTVILRHTPYHLNCPACNRSRVEVLRKIEPDMRFEDAADIWMESCRVSPLPGLKTARYIAETTDVSYQQYVDSLKLFFTGMRLDSIHFGNLREYQQLRVAGAEMFIRRRRPHEQPGICPAAPKKVNQELGILRRILRRGCCWTEELEEFYSPLEEEDSEAQRALSPEEQELWLSTASRSKRWEVVHWYSLLSIGTTMGTNEMQHLRIGDLNLWHRTAVVTGKGVKCAGRKRTIPLLSAEELWAAEMLLERAKVCGSMAPQHFVLPMRNRKYAWDPTRPMSNSGLKTPWNEVRQATGLMWFRPYDLRHTGGTRLAEDGVSAPIIKARMGHLTQQMHDHYMHISDAAQRREMERSAGKRFGPRAVSFGRDYVEKRFA